MGHGDKNHKILRQKSMGMTSDITARVQYRFCVCSIPLHTVSIRVISCVSWDNHYNLFDLWRNNPTTEKRLTMIIISSKSSWIFGAGDKYWVIQVLSLNLLFESIIKHPCGLVRRPEYIRQLIYLSPVCLKQINSSQIYRGNPSFDCYWCSKLQQRQGIQMLVLYGLDHLSSLSGRRDSHWMDDRPVNSTI